MSTLIFRNIFNQDTRLAFFKFLFIYLWLHWVFFLFLNFLNLILFIYLSIYFWLCWVSVSVWGLSLVAASRGHSSSQCAGLSLSRPLLLQSTRSRCAGSVVVAHGPSCSAACGIFPDQGSNPCPLHWQADSQPLCHQGSPRLAFMYVKLSVRLKLLESKLLFKTPCQNHARKAEKTSNFHIEAKPYPDPVHPKSTYNLETILGLPNIKDFPFFPVVDDLDVVETVGFWNSNFPHHSTKKLLEIMNVKMQNQHTKINCRASLVAQWLRNCLPMQWTRVRALIWEDPTCRGAAGPVSHNYWACASGACAPQQERLR